MHAQYQVEEDDPHVYLQILSQTKLCIEFAWYQQTIPRWTFIVHNWMVVAVEMWFGLVSSGQPTQQVSKRRDKFGVGR